MISRWSLWNFKSVRRRVDLKLSGITLLVGANSSGKSSILQSILLIKQTFQYGSGDNSLLLNGPLVRLGNFNDIRSFGGKSRLFGFSYELTPSTEGLRKRSRAGSLMILPSSFDVKIKRVLGSAEFTTPSRTKDELELQQPHILKSTISIEYSRNDTSNIARFHVKRSIPNKIQSFEKLRKDSGLQVTSLAIGLISDVIREEVSINRPDFLMHGANSRYFLPSRVLVSFDSKKLAAKELAEYLSKPNLSFSAAPAVREDFFAAAKEASLAWLNEINASVETIDAAEETTSVLELGQKLSPIFPRSTWSSLFPTIGLKKPSEELNVTSLKERILSNVLAVESDDFKLDYASAQPVQSANDLLIEYFTNYVRYLGPLREPPKPLYPLEALPDPTDVGYRGEHTAAVYDLNRNTEITYVRPPQGDDYSTNDPVNATLQTAVIDWLSYMEVLSGIKSDVRGKFGRELQVQTKGISRYHDLTNVGVGVSQVLPIVVLSLLSKRGSMLIFEQPELHLHPKVQSRLGDFFISLLRSGRQCLIETHSEYLIYRLRRRIAEANEKLEKRIDIYFTEQDEGQTAVRTVAVSKYGAISNWPKNFFDESQIESEMIIRMASRKRRQDKESSGREY
jgi:predicted ATPase